MTRDTAWYTLCIGSFVLIGLALIGFAQLIWERIVSRKTRNLKRK